MSVLPDLAPDTCISVHIFDNRGKVILQSEQSLYHKLFHVDNIFFNYDIVMPEPFKTNYKASVKYGTHVTMSYYYGKIYWQTYVSPKDIATGVDIKYDHTKTGHLQVSYPYYGQPLYVKTQAIGNPPGNDAHRLIHAYIYVTKTSNTGGQYWLSSIIYHINCVQHFQRITDWSGLNLSVVKQICFDEAFKSIKLEKHEHLYKAVSKESLTLQPSLFGNENSNLWKLEISFVGINSTADSYGQLTYMSNPLYNFCDVKNQKIPEFL